MKSILALFLTLCCAANLYGQDEALPTTQYGRPDLQGTWWYGSRTPLQRAEHLGEQRAFSIEEVKQIETRMDERNTALFAPLAPDRGAPEKGAAIRQEADDNFLSHFQDPALVPIGSEYRTSIIVSPANGRLPKALSSKTSIATEKSIPPSDVDGPEGQPLSGRCLAFGAAIPSLTPIMMNPNLQIVQTKDYLMIMTEMVHDARIIRLHENASPPKPSFDKWMGDSTGYWDGETLVINSRNFRPEQTSLGRAAASAQLEIIERLTLVDAGSILYGFEVRDPLAFSEPVIGERMLTRNDTNDRLYEFACHEGNYSLTYILQGARVQERGQ